MNTRLLWVTNHQAPYREPVWARLSARTDLRVAFLFAAERERRWRYAPSSDYASSLVTTHRLPVPARVGRMLTDAPVLGRPSSVGRLVDAASVGLLGGWEQPAYFQFLRALRRRRKPVVMFYESTGASHRFDSGPVDAVRSWYFRQADRVLVPSAGAAAALEALGVDDARIVRTANAVDLDAIAARAAATRAAADPVRSCTRRFIYVGQLIERKNVGALLAAFARLPVPARLLILGGGPLRAALGRRAVELGIGDVVDFVDHVAPDRVAEHLGRNDVLVLPSTEEVYGFTAVEALAAGLRVVVSDRAGVAPEIASLPGVHLTDPAVAPLAAALTEAARRWNGPQQRDLSAVAGVARVVADIDRTVNELEVRSRTVPGGPRGE